MSHGISIVGLGIQNPPALSAEMIELFQEATAIFLKGTDIAIVEPHVAKCRLVSPTILPVDQLTDGYQALTRALIQAAPTVLAVRGDPIIDGVSTALIQQAATEAKVPLTILPNQDILTATLRQLAVSPASGVQILDATLAASYHYPPLEPHRPALVSGIDHPDLIAPLKKALGAIYHSETQIQGLNGQQITETKLAQLSPVYSAIYIPAQTDKVGLTAFQETIAHLRAPSGCPWDLKQTHRTLRPYLLEETYEVLAALEAGDTSNLAEELGDLLLQIVLHAQIGADNNTFQMSDIMRQIHQKMIRRHPHVFGDIDVSGADEVLVNWETIKAQEKAEKGEQSPATSALDGVSLAAPALAQALDISKKAVKVGFEWESVEGVLAKLVEEAQEIAEATSPAEIEAEIGDFLFTAVNLARKLGVDAETALRACNLRFTRRFQQLEGLARTQALELAEMDKETWFNLWQQAKKEVAHLE